jgi:glutamate synthase (NADPH/NADH) large chain
VKGKFAENCNQEMVDLDPLENDDIIVLRQMISKHYNLTGSTVAKFILDDFENQLKNFIKVFPKDYKKALAKKSVNVEVNK